MASNGQERRGADRSGTVRRVLGEAILVVGVGTLFALAANWASPKGLVLARDYFPKSTGQAPPTNQALAATPTNAVSATNGLTVLARLKEKGLQVADSNAVIQVFRDPRYEMDLLMIVDARDDQHYQEGHVPGAYQLDHYHSQNYLPQILPAAQNAEKIVVYCNGGNCEDSEFTAITLSQVGVPVTKLFVYPGGMSEWLTNGLPVEIGARKSGQLKGVTP